METVTQKQSRTMKDYIVLAAKGFAIGTANLIPGVSGGTMAFIMGIYEELILSIKNMLDLQALKAFFTLKLKTAFEIWPWEFLLAIGIGVLVATFSLAGALEWTLENQPVLLWAFFFGLVLASIFTVLKRVSRWNVTTISAAVIAAVATYFLVDLVPAETPKTPVTVFFAGFIAIGAMILPGLSGSFVLVLLGQYEHVLSSVSQRDFATLFIFAVGAGVGLLTFAQILSWLFKRYHDVTVAILIGLMAGSLRKIWPWKEVVSTTIDRHGEEVPFKMANVLPATLDAEVAIAIALAVFGFALVFALERWAAKDAETVEPEAEPAHT